MTQMALERLDWKNEIIPQVEKILNERRWQGVPATTVRGIFYNLVALSHIENLQQHIIKGLSYCKAESCNTI